MKKPILICISATAVLVAVSSYFQGSSSVNSLFLKSEDPQISKAFISFMAKYGKTYASKTHLHSKFEIFKLNYELISKHNLDNSFEMGINEFSDLTEHEFLEIYGKSLLEHTSKPLLMQREEDYKEYDEKGRYHCRHDDELHDYFDYNDYDYIDEKLKTCGTQVNWVTQGKVTPPK